MLLYCLKKPKAIYPSLEEISGKKKHLLCCPSESGLDFAFQADLEEEAAKYEEERYSHGLQMFQGFLTQMDGPIFPFPPPYLPPFPSALPASLPVTVMEGLSQTKAALQAQISGLKQVLHLQQELGDLTLEIQDLQETLGKGPIAPKKQPNITKKPKPQSRLAFPVMTRAHAKQAENKPRSDCNPPRPWLSSQ